MNSGLMPNPPPPGGGGGGKSVVVTGGGVTVGCVTTGSKQPGIPCAAAAPAATAADPAAQTAARDCAVPRTLSDTRGSTATLALSGAAYAV